jgi:hypothetical protein
MIYLALLTELTEMIDWRPVITNSFWILGLAVILAALSYSYWAGGEEQTTFRQQLEKPRLHRIFAFAFVLVGIGLAGTSQNRWETALSAVLIIGSVLFFFALVGK